MPDPVTILTPVLCFTSVLYKNRTDTMHPVMWPILPDTWGKMENLKYIASYK